MQNMKNKKITLKEKIKSKIIQIVLNSREYKSDLKGIYYEQERIEEKLNNLKDSVEVELNEPLFLEDEIDDLKEKVDTLESDYCDVNDKVEDIEYRVDCLEDDLNDTTSRVDEYELTTRESPSNVEIAKGEVINALENLLNALKGGF